MALCTKRSHVWKPAGDLLTVRPTKVSKLAKEGSHSPTVRLAKEMNMYRTMRGRWHNPLARLLVEHLFLDLQRVCLLLQDFRESLYCGWEHDAFAEGACGSNALQPQPWLDAVCMEGVLARQSRHARSLPIHLQAHTALLIKALLHKNGISNSQHGTILQV